MASGRDPYIDFMRGSALLLLVVAHTSAPSLLMSVRTFDVPLMVFVSALCFRGGESYGSYCRRRARRIYRPTAVFLCVLFALSTFLPIVPARLMTPEIIAGSFMLWNWPAIPFVWIMRVFLLVALVMPLLDRAVRRLGFALLLSILAAVYVAQTLLCEAVDAGSRSVPVFILRDYVLYLTGYSIVAALGLAARGATLRRQTVLLLVCIAGVGAHVLAGDTFDPQATKYPPSALYLSYGGAASMALLMLRPVLRAVAEWSGWRYLSANSMWLYLWHTIPVFLMQHFDLFAGSWVLRFAYVSVSAIVLMMIWQALSRRANPRLAALME